MSTRFRYQREDGSFVEVGPEHPDYARLMEESGVGAMGDPHGRLKLVLVGLGSVVGAGVIFYFQYLWMRESQKYSMKLQMLAGAMLTWGLVSLAASFLPAEFANSKPEELLKPPKLMMGLGLVAVAVIGVVVSFQIHYGILDSLGYR